MLSDRNLTQSWRIKFSKLGIRQTKQKKGDWGVEDAKNNDHVFYRKKEIEYQ